MKWFVLAGVLAALALAAACGDDDASTPTDTPGGLTPVGTKDATPTSLAADVAGPPAPADPTLDEELAEIASGNFDEAIAAGDSWSIDTAAFARTNRCARTSPSTSRGRCRTRSRPTASI